MDWNTFLSRLDAQRDRLGLSDTALSEAAGLSRDGIRNWRRSAINNPESSPTVGSVMKVAEYLGVSISYLLGNIESSTDRDCADSTESNGGCAPSQRIPNSPDQTDPPALDQKRQKKPNEIKIETDGTQVQIIATLDLSGIRDLRSKLDVLEQLIE